MTKTAPSSTKKKVSRRKSPCLQKNNANDTKKKEKGANESTALAEVYFKDIREQTNDFEEVIPELGNINTKDISSNTLDYQIKQGNVLRDFLDYLSTSNMYKDKMGSVDFVRKGGKVVKAPSLLVACLCSDGIISEEKINLANQLLTGFAAQMKQKRQVQLV